jgi:hypothetical protein
LRGSVFEAGCRDPGWQSADTEYRDGVLKTSDRTVTLEATRRYTKEAGRIRVIDLAPNTFTVMVGKRPDGKSTLEGNVGVGPMLLVRE